MSTDNVSVENTSVTNDNGGGRGAKGDAKTCPAKHGLDEFKTWADGFGCDACKKEGIDENTVMYGCRDCDWDMCAACYTGVPDSERATETVKPVEVKDIEPLGISTPYEKTESSSKDQGEDDLKVVGNKKTLGSVLNRILTRINPFAKPSRSRLLKALVFLVLLNLFQIIALFFTPYVGVKSLSFAGISMIIFLIGVIAATGKLRYETEQTLFRSFIISLSLVSAVGVVWLAILLAEGSLKKPLKNFCAKEGECIDHSYQDLVFYITCFLSFGMVFWSFLTVWLVRETLHVGSASEDELLFNSFNPFSKDGIDCTCECNCNCGECSEDGDECDAKFVMKRVALVLLFLGGGALFLPAYISIFICVVVYAFWMKLDMELDDGAPWTAWSNVSVLTVMLVLAGGAVTACVYVFIGICSRPNTTYEDVTCIASVEFLFLLAELSD